METPVILPSGNWTDLVMLKKHLMNDPTDPYTWMPMKLEDVKVDEELKLEIDAYILKKKEEYEKGREERDWMR